MSSAVSDLGNTLGLGGGSGGAWYGRNSFSYDPYSVDTSAFNDPTYQARYQQMQQALSNYQGQQQATHANQAGLIQALQNQMAGNQPSVAANQLAQTTAANNQAALAQAASGASVNPAEALRQATYAQAGNTQNAAAQGAALRAQEQQAGAQALGNVLAGQAALQQQGALAEQGIAQNAAQTNTGNQMALQQLQSNNYNAAQSGNAQIAQANANATANMFKNVMSGAGQALAGMREGGSVHPFPAAIARHMADGGVSYPVLAGNVLSIVGGAGPISSGGGAGSPGQAGTNSMGVAAFVPALAAFLKRKLATQPKTSRHQRGAAEAGKASTDAAGLTGTDDDFGAIAGDSPTNFAAGFKGGGIARTLAFNGGVTPGHGARKADDIPALLSSGEVVEANDAVDYFDRHLGPGFLVKLNEVGKLGHALHAHHGIAVDPAELMRVLSDRRIGPRNTVQSARAGTRNPTALSPASREFIRRWRERRALRLAEGTDQPVGPEPDQRPAPQIDAAPDAGAAAPNGPEDGSVLADAGTSNPAQPTAGVPGHTADPRVQPDPTQPSMPASLIGSEWTHPVAALPVTAAGASRSSPARPAPEALDPVLQSVVGHLEDPKGPEGAVFHMYLDSKGNVTVGYGTELGKVEKAVRLPFVRRDNGQPATEEEIKAEFARAQKGSAESGTGSLPSLVLPERCAHQLVVERVKALGEELKAYLPDLRSYPPDAQRAIFDMGYNLGAYKLAHKFPNFMNAVRAEDWDAAAAESHRKSSDVNDTRNLQIKRWLQQASRSVTNPVRKQNPRFSPALVP